MPEQPINKAEEMLQRHARERRERGADFALHPATRRVLQGEVTRQFGDASGGERRGAFASWFTAWRGVSLACSLVVLLGIGAWMISRQFRNIGRSESELAKADVPSRSLTPVLKPAPEKPIVREELATSARAARRLSEPAASTPPPMASPMAPAPHEKFFAKKDADESGEKAKLTVSSGAASFDPKTTDAVLVRKMEFETVNNQNADATKASDAPVTNFRIAGSLNDSLSNVGAKEQQTPAAAADAFAQNKANMGRRDSADAAYSLPTARGGAEQLANNGGFAGGQQQQLRGAVNTDRSTTFANNAYFNQQVQNAPSGTAAPQSTVTSRAPQTPSTEPRRQYTMNSIERRRSEMTSQARADLELKQPEPTVLSRFSIEQIGTILRVTDADGSIYEGALFNEEVMAPEERQPAKGGAKFLLPKRESATPRRLAFRATGTNRTLNQLVVVNGKFAADPAAAPRAFAAKSLERGQAAQVVPANSTIPQTAPAFQKSAGAVIAPTNLVDAVEGTVRVGGSAERLFRAQRVIK